MLRNVGLAPEQWRGDVHRRVLDELRRRYVDTGVMNRDAWEALWDLRQLRIRADYELFATIRNRDVTRAINFFEAYLDECCRVLGVI